MRDTLFNEDLIFQTIAAAGVFASIYFGVDARRNRRKAQRLLRASTNFDWEQMLVAANVISLEMRREEFLPGQILAIHGGGGIFGELLSIELGEEIPLTTIHITSKTDPQEGRDGFLVKETTKWMQFIPRSFPQFDSNQKVVIVDDFCISGDSLESLRHALEELGIASGNIKTAAPICTQQAVEALNAPDYCWQEVDSGRVNFPWGPGQKLQRMGLAPSMTRAAD